MLWPGLSSTYYDQIALWFYEENVTHLAMPGIAKAHLTWNSVRWKFGFLSSKKIHAPCAFRRRISCQRGDGKSGSRFAVTAVRERGEKVKGVS